MSLLSWFSSKKSPATTSDAVPESAQSAPGQVNGAVDPLADLKQQRHLNRENLYELVRSVMLRSEVLSSHYKFKVLSLDTRGRQFVVMIDLLNDADLPPHRWADIEQLMANTALQHHDLQVKSVYWRIMPSTSEVAKTAPADNRSSPQPANSTVQVAAAQVPVAPDRHGYEPINKEEVMAFKRAIASGAQPANPVAGQVVHSGPRRAPPAHGFEDTQLLEPDPGSSPLSKTQFGGLD